jgi:phage/plasmid-like protein (TIGR03299 family)
LWGIRVLDAPLLARVPLPRRHGLYDRNLIVRDPVGPEKEGVVLGLVGSRYVPLQNTEAFAFFEPFIANHWASFHTAGALGNGERVWVLVRLSDKILIAGDDVIDKFLLLSNTHDGSGAVTIRFTPIRVVCQNTLDLAMVGGASMISVYHTKNITENLRKAQALDLKHIVDKVFAEAETLFGNMAARNLDANDTDLFLELLFPRTDKQKKVDQEPERWDRVRAVLNDPTVTPVKTRNTLWALYNAIVRAEDYRDSRQSAAARLERVWFGSGHDLKIRALNLARSQLQQAA